MICWIEISLELESLLSSIPWVSIITSFMSGLNFLDDDGLQDGVVGVDVNSRFPALPISMTLPRACKVTQFSIGWASQKYSAERMLKKHVNSESQNNPHRETIPSFVSPVQRFTKAH